VVYPKLGMEFGCKFGHSTKSQKGEVYETELQKGNREWRIKTETRV
jgi:hypothetical protein